MRNKKRNVGENNPMYGKNHTEESRKKMSETRKIKLDLEQINYLYTKENKPTTEIARIMNTSYQTIIRRLKEMNIKQRPMGIYERTEKNRLILSNRFKGKSYEERHGKKKALELKELRRANMTNRIVSELTRQKLRDRIASKETREKMSKNGKRLFREGKLANNIGAIGSKNLVWKGGISFEPYDKDFNKLTKQIVYELHGMSCYHPDKTNCKGQLTIHHIDYNKKNSTIKNLIPLCNSHNVKVNWDRVYWKKYFQKVKSSYLSPTLPQIPQLQHLESDLLSIQL